MQFKSSHKGIQYNDRMDRKALYRNRLFDPDGDDEGKEDTSFLRETGR